MQILLDQLVYALVVYALVDVLVVYVLVVNGHVVFILEYMQILLITPVSYVSGMDCGGIATSSAGNNNAVSQCQQWQLPEMQ